MTKCFKNIHFPVQQIICNCYKVPQDSIKIGNYTTLTIGLRPCHGSQYVVMVQNLLERNKARWEGYTMSDMLQCN